MGMSCPDAASRSIPASTAHFITSITMHHNTTLTDLSTFGSCSRLESLTSRSEAGMDQAVEVLEIQRLSKTCCPVQFKDFVPFVYDLSELKGWHCMWGKGQRANSQDGVSPIAVKIPEVANPPDKCFKLIRHYSC